MLKSGVAKGLWAASIALLSACVTAPVDVTAPAPRPVELTPAQIPRSAESLAIESHFTRLENQLLTQGLLRTDGGGPDSRFTRRDLVDNFIHIALYDEYVLSGGRLIARQTPSKLRRWREPVRFGVHFGNGIPATQREKDRTSVNGFARRLSRASGHPVSVTTGNANFLVLFLNEDEREEFAPRLRQIMPSLSARDAASVLSMPRHTLCHVFAWDPDDTGIYKRAVAVIRGEHPDLTRLSCIHEELAQGLGLANDYRDARPSIFNDDEEFGLLTTHDELLLRILYDPRLTPGTGPEEARPVVEQVVNDLIPTQA